MLGQRALTHGAPTDQRNYESESLIIGDQKSGANTTGILNDSSINESMIDRNRVNLSRDAGNNSIAGTILNKRQNSNDKITPLRPRSSKGNRVTNNSSIPTIVSQQQIGGGQ